jgi:competence protein ComEC
VDVRVVAAGDVIALGACTLEFLAPERGAQWVDVNDSSLVARVTAPSGRRMLLTGDIAKQAMVSLVTRAVDVKADALEVPHHGAAASFSYEFVQRVDPGVVVQSTGPSRVADPRWDVVKTGRRWFVTAVDGAVSLEFLPEGPVRARTFRGDGLRR